MRLLCAWTARGLRREGDAQVSITDEYARFAARMMVAAAFFDVADNDASGEMSKTELFEALRRVTITQSKVRPLSAVPPAPPPCHWPWAKGCCECRAGKESARVSLLFPR